MLSDDELQALREIERRLRWESPGLARLFNSDELRSVTNNRQRATARVLLAAAALTGLTLIGPRVLNEAEVRTQQRAPLPLTAPSETAIARRTAPVSGPAALTAPVAVVDISVGPSTIVATPLGRAA